MIDITLEAGGGLFNYRVGAVIINDGKLLMIKNESFPYYYSVGGRVSFGETSEEAVLREVYEETQLHFEIERLAFVHENFFVGGFRENKQFHEIAFFYLMKPNAEIDSICCDSEGADGSKESLHWLPLDALSDYPVYPEFFKTELKSLGSELEHFVTRSGETTSAK